MTVTIGLWVPSILLSMVAVSYSTRLPSWLGPLAALVAVVFVIAEVLILWTYANKIMLLRSPPRETQFITAMSVGAVSSITTFMGTAAALAVTVLVGTQQPVGSPSFGTLISFTMPTLWLFVLLTVRFDLACYLYQVWDLRGRPGLKRESP